MDCITYRESEVLELISLEHTTHEIAEILNISDHTASDHRKNLLHKMGARNVAGLIRRAYELGLLKTEISPN